MDVFDELERRELNTREKKILFAFLLYCVFTPVAWYEQMDKALISLHILSFPIG